MESYRDSLAAGTILPDSFEKIEAAIVRTAPTSGIEQLGLEVESLPEETLAFLAKIWPKTLQAEPTEEQASTDRFAHIRVGIDELQDHQRILDAVTQLLAQAERAYHDSDFRQVIGWLAWLLVLQTYSLRYLPDSDAKEKEMHKRLDPVIDMLKATADAARQAKDYDALLLAAAFCEWVGSSKRADEALGIVRDEIGNQAITDRLLHIKRQRRMLVDDLLVNRLHRYLGESWLRYDETK